jgi:hypothetical protein
MTSANTERAAAAPTVAGKIKNPPDENAAAR